MEKGVPIRSISRAIAALQAINRHGSLSLMDIANMVGVPYATACRIVQTLVYEGLIEREPTRKHYRAAPLVHTLSYGFQDEDRLARVARPRMVDLTRKVGWPISICTHVGSSMMVRASTHALTSLTLSNYHPGYTLPILESAAGRAYLGFAPEDERQSILASLDASRDAQADGLDLLSMFRNGVMVAEIRAKGYATKQRNRFTENPGKTSSFAVPLFDGEVLAGALSLVFFTSAMKMELAVEKYLDDMRATAGKIAADLVADQQLHAA